MNLLAAESPTIGNPVANIAIFAAFVVITLFVVIRAGRKKTSAAEFFTGGREFTGAQNGIAIAGDYLSAASFLGIAGAVAVYGYDGFLYSIGFLVAWLVALLLVAELMRNTGKFTMADVLSLPTQAEAGTAGRCDVDDDRVAVLPAGPDGRRGRPGGTAARHQGSFRPEHRHRGRRCADDLLRPHRRYAWHHMGADHQGRAADHRCSGDDRDGDGEVRA